MDAKTKVAIKQADSAFAEGRFAEAEAFYHQALAIQPNIGRIEGQIGLIAFWRNDLTKAETYLKAALQNGPWLTRHWPISAQITYRLALSCVRQGKVKEASKLFREAAGPLPFGPFKALKVNADQFSLFDDTGFYHIHGPEVISVPFVMVDPLPVVQVSINGAAQVNFFIDTGGEGITLDHAFAKEVGAVLVGEYPGEYAGGKQGMTGFGKIDELRLGDATITNIPVSTLDLEPTSKRVFAGMPVAGIIGTGFLMRFLSTIDYPNRQLVLHNRSMADAEINAALGLDGTEYRFPIWLVEAHLIFAEGSINGLEPMPMFIDTGLAGAAFMTSKKTYSRAGVEMDWSKPITGAGGGGEVKGIAVAIDKLTLGSGDTVLRKQNLIGVVTEHDNSIFTGAAGFKVGGLISHQFFRDHALTFDFQNMRLIVK